MHPITKKTSMEGFTLIELLISIFIIGFFSLAITQITIQASKGLTNVTKNAMDIQSSIRFSNLIKYDFAGSKEIYAHSQVPTTITDSICTSYVPGGTSPVQNWDTPDPNGLTPYVRGLFTIQIDELSYDKNSSGSQNIWIDPKTIAIGYEIRKNTGSKEFELWRLVCSNGAIGLQQKMLNLGEGSTIVPANSCNFLVGTPAFSCDSPTAATTDSYAFTLPYLGTNSIVKKFNSTLEFSVLNSRIDK